MGKVSKSYESQERHCCCCHTMGWMVSNMDMSVLVSQRATAVLHLDTTNPAAYKTIEDFQSDEVTKAGREKEV